MKINVPDKKNLNDSSIITRVKSKIVNRLDLMDQNILKKAYLIVLWMEVKNLKIYPISII
jgi:transcription termination factor NusB